MAIIYPEEMIQALLSEVDENGVHLKKWNSDQTEIIDTTSDDRAAELTAIRLRVVNAHGIHLWKLVDGVAVARSSEEIAADEYQYTLAHFDFNVFWGQVFAQLSLPATYALCGFERPIESLFIYPNIEGIRPFVQGLVGIVLQPGSYTVLQSDAEIIFAAFAAQGVNV